MIEQQDHNFENWWRRTYHKKLGSPVLENAFKEIAREAYLHGKNNPTSN